MIPITADGQGVLVDRGRRRMTGDAAGDGRGGRVVGDVVVDPLLVGGRVHPGRQLGGGLGVGGGEGGGAGEGQVPASVVPSARGAVQAAVVFLQHLHGQRHGACGQIWVSIGGC